MSKERLMAMADSGVSEKVCENRNSKIAGAQLVENFCLIDKKQKIYIAMRLVIMSRMQRKSCKVSDANKMIAHTAVGL